MTVKEYAFPDDPSSQDYRVFPTQLENDEQVLFHATPEANRGAIIRDGFKFPDPQSGNPLRSVSFAKNSITALTHAMHMRKNRPGNYCIFAVRYASLDRQGLKVNLIDVHDYTLTPPPKIIGYCIVPATYLHQ